MTTYDSNIALCTTSRNKNAASDDHFFDFDQMTGIEQPGA